MVLLRHLRRQWGRGWRGRGYTVVINHCIGAWFPGSVVHLQPDPARRLFCCLAQFSHCRFPKLPLYSQGRILQFVLSLWKYSVFDKLCLHILPVVHHMFPFPFIGLPASVFPWNCLFRLHVYRGLSSSSPNPLPAASLNSDIKYFLCLSITSTSSWRTCLCISFF